MQMAFLVFLSALGAICWERTADNRSHCAKPALVLLFTDILLC